MKRDARSNRGKKEKKGGERERMNERKKERKKERKN